MSEPFVGQIIQGGWSFAPAGYALCQGQLLAIAQNQALFALLGTTYGGNGQSTFGLPDLRGRTMVGQGQGLGLSPYVLGQTGGTETNTLNIAQMPQHNHTATFAPTGSSLNATATKATAVAPATGSLLGKGADTSSSGTAIPSIYVPSGTASVPLGGLNVAGTVTVGIAGGGQPVNNLAPYLAITQCIALTGIFPSRN